MTLVGQPERAPQDRVIVPILIPPTRGDHSEKTRGLAYHAMLIERHGHIILKNILEGGACQTEILGVWH